MKRSTVVMIVLSLVAVATACEKKDNGETSTTVTTKTKTESKTPGASSTSETTTVTKTTEAAIQGEIGVAACDEYVKKMEDCATRAPAEAAGPIKDSIASMQKGWKEAASTSAGLALLATTCKDSLAAARNAYASIGCAF